MNKRQRKKHKTKTLLMETYYCGADSYREYKIIDRAYHEFCIGLTRYIKIHGDWLGVRPSKIKSCINIERRSTYAKRIL